MAKRGYGNEDQPYMFYVLINVFDSRAMMTYLASKYDNTDLYPKDVQKRALVDNVMFFDVTSVYKAVGELVVGTGSATGAREGVFADGISKARLTPRCYERSSLCYLCYSILKSYQCSHQTPNLKLSLNSVKLWTDWNKCSCPSQTTWPETTWPWRICLSVRPSIFWRVWSTTYHHGNLWRHGWPGWRLYRTMTNVTAKVWRWWPNWERWKQRKWAKLSDTSGKPTKSRHALAFVFCFHSPVIRLITKVCYCIYSM